MPAQKETLGEIRKIKNEVAQALKLFQERHTGADLGEARNVLLQIAEVVKRDDLAAAQSLVQKAQLAANPTTEYLLDRAKNLESRGSEAYRKEDFIGAIELWQKSLKEYQNVREMANRRKEREIIDAVVSTVASIEEDIRTADREKANRGMVLQVRQTNRVVDEAKSQFSAGAFDTAIEKFHSAREQYSSAAEIARKYKFEDEARLNKVVSEMDTSIEVSRLSKGENLIEAALKEKGSQKETACSATLQFPESFQSTDPRYTEYKARANAGVAQARIEVGKEIMAEAEALFNKKEYYKAKEGYRKAQDHFNMVSDFAEKQRLEKEKMLVDTLIQGCAANAGACADALMGRERVAVGRLERVEELQNGLKPSRGPRTPSDDKIKLLENEYEIIKWLKSGGFGNVCVAKRREDGAVVALKIPIELDKRSEKVFLREMKIWQDLVHRNIVKLLQTRILPTPLFEMEYVDGGDLKRLIENDKEIPVLLACRIAFDIARGLDYAHSKHNVSHADLKPANILITRTQEAKISDWGLAKIASGSSSAYGHTPDYDTLEYIEKKQVDKRTDVYQLGLILYEMLTLDNPFAHGSEVEMAEKVLKLAPDKPSMHANRPELEPLDDIVMRCLEKDPTKRPTIGGFREIIYEYAKEYHGESLHISKDVNTEIKLLCQNAILLAKQNEYIPCLATLRRIRSKVGDNTRKEDIESLIHAIEFRQKEGIEMGDESINELYKLLTRVEHGET